MVGGTTAMSGGMLWIPGNHYQREAGIEESDEDIVAYLDALAPGALDPDTLGAFMESGPEMIRYFADRGQGQDQAIACGRPPAATDVQANQFAGFVVSTFSTHSG